MKLHFNSKNLYRNYSISTQLPDSIVFPLAGSFDSRYDLSVQNPIWGCLRGFMFCPECGKKYQVGFNRCGICGSPLREEIVEEPKPKEPNAIEPESNVKVAETMDLGKLAKMKSHLEHAGIKYTVEGEPLNELMEIERPIKLLVEPALLDKAREKLKGFL